MGEDVQRDKMQPLADLASPRPSLMGRPSEDYDAVPGQGRESGWNQDGLILA